MPVVLRWKGYRFFFYSNEGDPREPVHIHIQKAEALAKFWVKPIVELDHSYGLSSKELKQLKEVVENHQEEIKRYWNEHFA